MHHRTGIASKDAPLRIEAARTFVARPYFLAQNSTRGGPTSGPPLHSTSRSPIEIGNVLGPQKAEIATSSLPQPLEQPLDRQSSRRTARCPAGPTGPTGPVSPLSPLGPAAPAPVSPLRPCGPAGPAGPATPAAPVSPLSPLSPLWPCGPKGPAGADIAPIRDAGTASQCPDHIAQATGQSGIALVCRTCRTRGAPSSVWLQSHRANRNRAASSQTIVTP